MECLQDNNQTEGHMYFLGGGIINGGKYTFYTKVNDSYYLGSIDANGTPVRYTNGKPRIEWYREEMKFPLKGINWWAIDLDDDSNNQRVIYVPKGTIKGSYNLDAQ